MMTMTTPWSENARNCLWSIENKSIAYPVYRLI